MERVRRIILISILVLTGIVAANPGLDSIWSAYVRGEFGTVVNARDQILNEQSTSPKTLFLKALFETDAEKALAIYQTIINQSDDGELRYRAAQKIYQYYYAMGFYITADEFKTKFGLDKEVVVHSSENNPTLEIPPLKYIIQLGAFSDRGNAEKVIKRIENLNLSILIKTKEIGGVTLHLVWVGPFTNENDAQNWQGLIEEKYGIHSKIKPMD